MRYEVSQSTQYGVLLPRTPSYSMQFWHNGIFFAYAVIRITFRLRLRSTVIGTSNVVILSMGGDTSITSLPLGAFFIGSSLISCGITEPLFRRYGRKVGFLTGIALGLVATGLGVWSLLIESPALNIVSALFFGTSTGIGFFLRFAAVELVPRSWHARAVTLVVSGGVIAAFAGPESGQATSGIFSDDENMLYMGVYMMAGIFSLANFVLISAVRFPLVAIIEPDTEEPDSPDSQTKVGGCIVSFVSMYKSLFKTRSFVTPMLISTLSWSIMAVPMSVLRVAMKDAGYTSRQSLSAIELHFCGMYATGFVTGSLIQRFGVCAVCWAGFVVCCVSVILNLLSETAEEGTIATWLSGMIGVGIGWNFCFTAATVWLTKTVDEVSYTKGQVQAANDCFMFLITGGWVVGSSYIYDAGFVGSGILSGWISLNVCVIGLVFLLGFALVTDSIFAGRQRREHKPNDANKDQQDAEFAEVRAVVAMRHPTKVAATNDSVEVPFDPS